MGRKDAVTKVYMEQNNIFADAFNYYIFGGQQVIMPERLKALDITELAVPYGADSAGEPEQKYRDVMKSLTAMYDEQAAYLLLGIENQSDVNYAMPVKNLLYDALNYAKQVQEAAASHREEKDYKGHNQGEFLSGFYKEDKLIPVITLVIFFSPDPWDGPMTLREMMSVRDKRLLSLVPDYQVHLIAPSGLSDEGLDKFRTTLREVLAFIKYSKDMDKLDKIVNDNFRNLRKNEIDVLNQCVNAKLRLEEGEEELIVCKALEDMKKNAAQKATEETRKITHLEDIKNVMEAFHVSAEQAMKALKIQESESSRFLSML